MIKFLSVTTVMLTILPAIFLSGCGGKKMSTKIEIPYIQRDPIANAKADTLSHSFDTTLLLFRDTAFKLVFHVFQTDVYDNEKKNATVSFMTTKGEKLKQIFKDSFYCMYPDFQFSDFNNDKIKDVLFFFYTGARANPTYHLYLIDTIHQKLTYVKDFEYLPNPELVSDHNIISSSALYGANVAYSFFRINSNGKLVDLGHSFEAEFGDEKKFARAINQISKESSSK